MESNSGNAIDKVYTAMELEAAVRVALWKDAEADETALFRLLKEEEERYGKLSFWHKFIEREQYKTTILRSYFLVGFIQSKKDYLRSVYGAGLGSV